MSKKSIMSIMKKLFFAALIGVFATLGACSDEGLNLGLNVNNLASTPESLNGSTWRATYESLEGLCDSEPTSRRGAEFYHRQQLYDAVFVPHRFGSLHA